MSIPTSALPTCRTGTVNIQQAFGNKTTVEVGYVGSKGTRSSRFRDINQPSQAQITAYDTGPAVRSGFTSPNCPIAGFDSGGNVPRTAYPNFFYVNQEESTAFSTYNALQASLHVNGGTAFRRRRTLSGRTPSTTPAIWKTSFPMPRSPTTA